MTPHNCLLVGWPVGWLAGQLVGYLVGKAGGELVGRSGRKMDGKLFFCQLVIQIDLFAEDPSNIGLLQHQCCCC